MLCCQALPTICCIAFHPFPLNQQGIFSSPSTLNTFLSILSVSFKAQCTARPRCIAAPDNSQVDLSHNQGIVAHEHLYHCPDMALHHSAALELLMQRYHVSSLVRLMPGSRASHLSYQNRLTGWSYSA